MDVPVTEYRYEDIIDWPALRAYFGMYEGDCLELHMLVRGDQAVLTGVTQVVNTYEENFTREQVADRGVNSALEQAFPDRPHYSLHTILQEDGDTVLVWWAVGLVR